MPFLVDGVDLDQLTMWGLNTYDGIRGTASVRHTTLQVPSRDGEMVVLNEPIEPLVLKLSLFVNGVDQDGYVPSGFAAFQVFEENLDALLAIFSQRHRLLTIQHEVRGELRQAEAQVLSAMVPGDVHPGGFGKLDVLLSIPSGTWRSPDVKVDEIDWTVSLSNQILMGLRGSTARITDPVIVVTGPSTDMWLTDAASQSALWIKSDLASGQRLRIDGQTLTAVKEPSAGSWGTDLLGGTGTDVTGEISYTSRGSLLSLTPYLSDPKNPYLRDVRVKITGSGLTVASKARFYARKAWVG